MNALIPWSNESSVDAGKTIPNRSSMPFFPPQSIQFASIIIPLHQKCEALFFLIVLARVQMLPIGNWENTNTSLSF